MGLDNFAKFQIAIGTIVLAVAGINLHERHLQDARYMQMVEQSKEATALVVEGSREKLFHLSQAKLDFVPYVEMESNPSDRMEKLYRLQCQRGF